jgi:hypothetical protein
MMKALKPEVVFSRLSALPEGVRSFFQRQTEMEGAAVVLALVIHSPKASPVDKLEAESSGLEVFQLAQLIRLFLDEGGALHLKRTCLTHYMSR